MDRRILISLLVFITITSAGCSSLSLSSQSIRDPRVRVIDSSPAIIFNYSVDDYATALLEHPNGQVINEARLEPDKNIDGMRMGEPEPGTYKLVIQQGGETVSEREISFSGPDPKIVDVEAQWSKNTVQSISVTIENSGDLPLRVSNATYSARGETVEIGPIFQWIDVNQTRQITLESSFGGSITVNRPGEVRGDVKVETSNKTLSGSFKKTFQGAKLEIADLHQYWEKNTLERVEVEVQNVGDLPTSANTSIRYAGETLAYSGLEDIGVGQLQSFELVSLGYIYRATSGGTVELDLVVDSSAGFESETLSHHVEPANLSLVSVQPNWKDGELVDVSYEVKNQGEIEGSYVAKLVVDGDTWETREYQIDPLSTDSHTFSNLLGPLGYATEGGNVSISVRIEGPQGSESITKKKHFEGIQGSISDVSTLFIGNYDSDTSDLTSLDLRIQNTGDIQLIFDAVKISMDGVSQTDSFYSEEELAPGESERIYLDYDLTVSNGQHDMKIEVINNGETLISTTVTVST